MNKLTDGTRTYGTKLLNKQLEEENANGPCVRYFVDIDKLNQGIIERISEPETFEQTEEMWKLQSTFSLPILTRKDEFDMRIEHKPTREELAKLMQMMTLKEMAKHFGAGSSTVSKMD